MTNFNNQGHKAPMGSERKTAEQIFEELPTVNDAGLFYDAETFARAAGISTATARRLAHSGQLKAVKVGKQWRFPVETLRAVLEVE